MKDYFAFYGLPVSFNPDTTLVKQKFYEYSKKYHPDFYINESEEKQAEVLELSTVNNKAYQAFNNIQKLVPGDEILIESDQREYDYKVTAIKITDTEEAHVNFKNGRNMVTLSTCNVFGAKEERHVVEADFVKSVSKVGQ